MAECKKIKIVGLHLYAKCKALTGSAVEGLIKFALLHDETIFAVYDYCIIRSTLWILPSSCVYYCKQIDWVDISGYFSLYGYVPEIALHYTVTATFCDIWWFSSATLLLSSS